LISQLAVEMTQATRRNKAPISIDDDDALMIDDDGGSGGDEIDGSATNRARDGTGEEG
jgi:hypothetical protein